MKCSVPLFVDVIVVMVINVMPLAQTGLLYRFTNLHKGMKEVTYQRL
jgi:hypothetical protein